LPALKLAASRMVLTRGEPVASAFTRTRVLHAANVHAPSSRERWTHVRARTRPHSASREGQRACVQTSMRSTSGNDGARGTRTPDLLGAMHRVLVPALPESYDVAETVESSVAAPSEPTEEHPNEPSPPPPAPLPHRPPPPPPFAGAGPIARRRLRRRTGLGASSAALGAVQAARVLRSFGWTGRAHSVSSALPKVGAAFAGPTLASRGARGYPTLGLGHVP